MRCILFIVLIIDQPYAPNTGMVLIYDTETIEVYVFGQTV